jgi:hypothetical protein
LRGGGGGGGGVGAIGNDVRSNGVVVGPDRVIVLAAAAHSLLLLLRVRLRRQRLLLMHGRGRRRAVAEEAGVGNSFTWDRERLLEGRVVLRRDGATIDILGVDSELNLSRMIFERLAILPPALDGRRVGVLGLARPLGFWFRGGRVRKGNLRLAALAGD